MPVALRLLSFAFIFSVFGVASPAQATGKYSVEQCKRFFERIESVIADHQVSLADDDRVDVDRARYALIRQHRRGLLLKTKYCLYAVYHGPPNKSRASHANGWQNERWKHSRFASRD